jgi:hypothetical protein
LTFSTPVCFSIEIRAHKHTELSSNNSGPFHLNSPCAQRVDSFVAFSSFWTMGENLRLHYSSSSGFLLSGKIFFFSTNIFTCTGNRKKRKKLEWLLDDTKLLISLYACVFFLFKGWTLKKKERNPEGLPMFVSVLFKSPCLPDS